MAEGMEIVATGDVGLDGQPVHQLPDAIRSKRTPLDIEPEGIATVGGTLRQIGQDRLHAGFAQKNLAPSALAVYKHQSRTKLANPTLDKMGIDLLTTRFTRPDDLLPVVTCQAGSVVGELEPFALTILRDEAHDAIALQATAEVPPALLGRLPHLCTVVPTVHPPIHPYPHARRLRARLHQRTEPRSPIRRSTATSGRPVSYTAPLGTFRTHLPSRRMEKITEWSKPCHCLRLPRRRM